LRCRTVQWRQPRCLVGVELIELKGGDAGQSLLVLEAKNDAAAGQTALPAGIAAVLSSISTATVRSRG
jgi:hypothetical protein